MPHSKPSRPFVLVLALVLGGAAPLAARSANPSCVQQDTPNKILPGDPRWAADLNVYPNATNFGTVGITGNNPRSGNGSLEATTSGSLFDWAFFQRLATGGAFGLLSSVNCVTFDWFRAGYTLPPDAPASLLAETWQEQTPVLRLMVRDVVNGQVFNSQLVWERWYNTLGVLSPTPNDQWNYEDLTGQLFWRHFDGGNVYTNAGCANGAFDGSANLQTYDLSGWVSNCYSSSAVVYGIMIGLGSSWPGAYHANLDNVQLAFDGQSGFAVQDNFELTNPTTVTPEPGTIVLLLTGFVVIGGMALVRRKKSIA
ncbi:MAG TPA: PEP-CTERM sorting domain-containing protein [Gemmatimonadales bacterium]|nr:PEP-CTERM sorting domain-containing protein [Gemmatimonadales bacterium]